MISAKECTRHAGSFERRCARAQKGHHVPRRCPKGLTIAGRARHTWPFAQRQRSGVCRSVYSFDKHVPPRERASSFIAAIVSGRLPAHAGHHVP